MGETRSSQVRVGGTGAGLGSLAGAGVKQGFRPHPEEQVDVRLVRLC